MAWVAAWRQDFSACLSSIIEARVADAERTRGTEVGDRVRGTDQHGFCKPLLGLKLLLQEEKALEDVQQKSNALLYFQRRLWLLC